MTHRHFKVFVILLIASGYAWLAWNWNDGAKGETQPLCLIKYATGLACPSCGTTRAVVQLAEGNIVRSVQTNPLGLIAAGFLLLAPFWLGYDFLKNKNATWLTYCWAEKKIQSNTVVSVALVVLVTVNWIWNIWKNL